MKMAESDARAKSSLITQGRHYWHTLLKWKWTAILFFIIVMGGTVLFSFLAKPEYTSRGSVWIEEQANILPFANVQTFDPGSYLTSHSKLLQSRALAAEIIEKRKLYQNPHFVGSLVEKQTVDPSSPIFRETLITKFLDSISVRSIERTRLVEVTFTDSDPKFASETLNTLFDAYINMIVQQRYRASEQAAEFLKTQIMAVRSEIEESEKKLSEYGSAKDILPLSAAETPIVTRLAELDRNLTEAKIDTINKYNSYNQIKSTTLGDSLEALNNPVIQRLREQYTTLSREYSKRLTTVRPEYPEMQRMKSELDTAKSDLEAETQKMIRAAYADYQTAVGREAGLQRLLNEQKAEAFKANSSSVVYNSLRVELQNKKALLEALSRRQSETDVSSRLQGLEAANVWIVDKADFPLRPTFPDKRKIVALGFLLGLVGSAGLAFLIEYLNSTVKTSKDVANSTGLPILGVIPAFQAEVNPKGPRAEFATLVKTIRGERQAQDDKPSRRKGDLSILVANAHGSSQDHESRKSRLELITSREPHSIQSESYRSIRTTLLVSTPLGKIKSILFTSPLAREGKSVTLSNLGVTLSQSSKRVVIIDADLRKPKQSRIFGLNSGWGLTQFVSSSIEPADIVRPTQFPNLFLIRSGPIPANPIELLTSERMDALIAFLKRSFDYILFDAPPVLAVSDALAMGPMIDGVILVTRGGQTPLPALKQAKQKLDDHRLKCLGVILNGVNLIEQDGYYAKQYYHYTKPE
jgi:succinoglycan biosynthesis transport protein ExoP